MKKIKKQPIRWEKNIVLENLDSKNINEKGEKPPEQREHE